MEVLTKPQKTSTEKKVAAAEPETKEVPFLAPATESTKRIWKKLEDLFIEKRKKGVLDVPLTPSLITAHAPGYIDKDNEVIVELQTDVPLKRAIMPNGDWRMVLSFLKTYGYEAPSRWWTRSKSIAHTALAPILFTAAGKKSL